MFAGTAVSRRRYLRAAAGALAIGLAACGATQGGSSAEGQPKPSGQKTAIEWWAGWGATGLSADMFKKVEEAANQVETRSYEVTLTPQSSVAKKLTEVIAAGSPPDVQVGNLSYAEFWARGMVMPLDKWLNKSRAIKKDDLLASSWKYGSYKGKVYGVPAVEGFVRWGLAANEELLQKRGYAPDQIPATWDDLYAWHRELTVVDPGTKAITQLGLDPRNAMGGGAGGGDPFYWGPAWNFKYYDEAKDAFNLTDPKLEAAVTTMKRFYDVAGGLGAVREFRKTYGTWSGAKSGIAMGAEAMQINGYWTPGELAKNASDKKYAYTWVPVPQERKGKKIQATGGHFVVIPQGAKSPDPAFEFIEFLTGEQAEQIIFDGTGWIGARKSFLGKLDASKYRGLDFYVKTAGTADETWETAVNPIEGFFSDELGKTLDSIILGELGPKAALEELQRKCTEELRQRLGK
jgi:multiple sugar transport system substrate-binding protein